MSSANANSSEVKRKELMLGKFNSLAVEFDKEVTIIPNKNKSYSLSTEDGFLEIKAYSNPIIQKDGKTKRINKKTGKAYVTRTVPKGLQQKHTRTTTER